MPTSFPYLSTSQTHPKPHSRHQLFAVLSADLFFPHYGWAVLLLRNPLPQMTLFYVFFKIYSSSQVSFRGERRAHSLLWSPVEHPIRVGRSSEEVPWATAPPLLCASCWNCPNALGTCSHTEVLSGEIISPAKLSRENGQWKEPPQRLHPSLAGRMWSVWGWRHWCQPPGQTVLQSMTQVPVEIMSLTAPSATGPPSASSNLWCPISDCRVAGYPEGSRGPSGKPGLQDSISCHQPRERDQNRTGVCWFFSGFWRWWRLSPSDGQFPPGCA